MKKLLALFLAMFQGTAHAQTAKIGTDGDQIRQMLFASQSIKELVSRATLDGKPGPFQSLAEAGKLIDAGRKQEAIKVLRKILSTPELETRVQLWVWAALRELGEKPEAAAAFEVLGVILEVGVGPGYDTLAGYVDGSARYLNHSGAAILWDAEDVSIQKLCQDLVGATIPAARGAKPRLTLALPKSGDQVTILTRSGNFVIGSLPGPVMTAGIGLMQELMRRSEKKK